MDLRTAYVSSIVEWGNEFFEQAGISAEEARNRFEKFTETATKTATGKLKKIQEETVEVEQ